MDLKENCRAWHSRLGNGFQHRKMTVVHGMEVKNLREVPGGLLVFRLFFREKASKRDNISVDLLFGYRSASAVALRHFQFVC